MSEELRAALGRMRQGVKNPLYYAFPLQPKGHTAADCPCVTAEKPVPPCDDCWHFGGPHPCRHCGQPDRSKFVAGDPVYRAAEREAHGG